MNTLFLKRLMPRLKRGISMLLLVTSMNATTNAFANNEVLEDNLSDRPSVGAMVLDAAIARPLMLVATVAGSALFVVSLPFSALGGNVKESARTLVAAPAKNTFTRCLGCTHMQDVLKNDASTDSPQISSKPAE